MPKSGIGGRRIGTATKGGKLRRSMGRADRYEQLDVSAMQGFPVKLKDEFEKFLDMQANEVEYGYLIDENGKVVAGARGTKHSVAVAYDGDEKGFDSSNGSRDMTIDASGYIDVDKAYP